MADRPGPHGAGQLNALQWHQGHPSSRRPAGVPQGRHQARSTATDGATRWHEGGMMGGMGGMMGGGTGANLKKLEPGIQVKAISYCHDTYRVTTADGKTRAFWERNLRFRTDSSKDGPEKGSPAIMPAGMMGDRASVIFAAPDEIAKIIEPRC